MNNPILNLTDEEVTERCELYISKSNFDGKPVSAFGLANFLGFENKLSLISFANKYRNPVLVKYITMTDN